MPVFYDETPDELKAKFAVLNGLLLPGGGAKLRPGHPFYDTAALLFDLAIKVRARAWGGRMRGGKGGIEGSGRGGNRGAAALQYHPTNAPPSKTTHAHTPKLPTRRTKTGQANDAGDYFPVHGTCLGFETLAILVTRNYTLLADTDAEDAPAPLLYTAEAEGSRLLRALPPSVVRDLQNSPIAMENHAHGEGWRFGACSSASAACCCAACCCACCVLTDSSRSPQIHCVRKTPQNTHTCNNTKRHATPTTQNVKASS